MQRPGTAPPIMARAPVGRLSLLRRQGTTRITGKLFVVAVDGSRMSFRACRLAAWFHDDKARDKIKVVSVVADMRPSEALEHIKAAEQALRDCGVRDMFIIPGEGLKVSEGSNLVDTLWYAR